MTLTLRARFALLAGLLVLVVASMVAMAGYATMRSSLLHRAARSADSQARRLAQLVDSPSQPADAHSNQVDITDQALTHGLGDAGTMIEVHRPSGGLIQASELPMPLPASLLNRCTSVGHAATRVDRPALSVACQRIGTAGSPSGSVSVGTHLDDVFASLGTLRTALVLGVVGGSVLAAALALLLARRATRPIRRIAEAAETIRSGDLGRRIDYSGRDELGALARVLDACFAELEHAIERQRRFGAEASHELRTPLAAIRANVELLDSWAATEPAAREAALASIDQSSRRAARLVEDLLYLAKLERRITPARAPARLDELVLGVVREAGQLRDDVSIEVSHLDEATVEGDAMGLQQLLINLVDNALRVSPAGGVVSIQLRAGEQDASVSVSDHGPGIEGERLGRIFDRFHTSNGGAGAGLGLSIARAIAEEHGGKLRVTSVLAAGAMFTVTLPLMSADVSASRPCDQASTDRAEARHTARAAQLPPGSV
jgi:two-component system sensor histidine kinase MprB